MTTKTKTKIDASPEKPSPNDKSKARLWQDTLDIWRLLCDENYNPADLGCGTVTMRYGGFKSLVKDTTGGSVSIQETRNYRLNSIWIDDIEICYTELKAPDKTWVVLEDWQPLETYV